MVMFVERIGRRAASARQAALAGALLCLAGCGGVERFYSSKLPLETPIGWWHDLQGGVIADERPPPPGIADPYPNLASVPARPTPMDPATRRALSTRLAAERDQATRQAAQDPIVPPKPAPAAPALPAGAKASAVPEAPPPMARIEAAESAPPPPAPPSPAAPPAPPSIQAAAQPTPPPRRAAATPNAEPVVSGPVPALPTAVPPLPSLAGIPAATTQPATPRPRPQVDAAFVPGSAVLRPESEAALRQLAARRGGGTVGVLGGGDAGSALPDRQAEALPLAWRRARAIQDTLVAAGVPTAALRVDAAALARGGVARLID